MDFVKISEINCWSSKCFNLYLILLMKGGLFQFIKHKKSGPSLLWGRFEHEFDNFKISLPTHHVHRGGVISLAYIQPRPISDNNYVWKSNKFKVLQNYQRKPGDRFGRYKADISPFKIFYINFTFFVFSPPPEIGQRTFVDTISLTLSLCCELDDKFLSYYFDSDQQREAYSRQTRIAQTFPPVTAQWSGLLISLSPKERSCSRVYPYFSPCCRRSFITLRNTYSKL